MVQNFRIWSHAAASPGGHAQFDAGLRAGVPVVADAFHPTEGESTFSAWVDFVVARGGEWPTRYGVRVGGAQLPGLTESAFCEGLSRVILVASESSPVVEGAVRALRGHGIEVYWEYALGVGAPVDPALLDGIVVRGYETGGISRSASVRTLFSAARAAFPEMPVMVQGIESPEMAAVFLLLGAAGVILDASLSFGEAFAGGPGVSTYQPSGFVRIALGGKWVDVGYAGAGVGEGEHVPMGPGCLTHRPRHLGSDESVLSAFREDVDLALGRLLSVTPEVLDSLCGTPAFVQGPMAMISTNTAFASAMTDEGIFPVFAFTGLQGPALDELAQRVCSADGVGDYGVGIAGRMDLSPSDALARFSTRPPAVLLLSGDSWGQRDAWRQAGSMETWLHVQHTSMLEQGWNEGFRHFVLEGCESGGHVGLLPSSVLWPLVLNASTQLDGERHELHCVLAGGIHDAESVLFGLLTASAYGFSGRLSFMMGTRLLLTEEATATGALHAAYQEVLCRADATRVVGKQSLGVRAAVSGEDSVPADSELAAVYDSYGRALKGETGELCLAGECVGQCDKPMPLGDLVQLLAGYGRYWSVRREKAAACIEATVASRASSRRDSDLAIVGLGGLFPGAANVEAFWENLRTNQRQIREVPEAHWGAGAYRCPEGESSDQEQVSYAWHAGMITDFTFDHFDCLKFHISPKAAEVADRIHLMLLKVTEEARVSAGAEFQLPEEETVVLIGNSMGGEATKLGTIRVHIPDVLESIRRTPAFEELDAAKGERLLEELKEVMSRRSPGITEDTLVGCAGSTLAGRISGYLKVYGGNMTVDAACASSLASVAVASEMLLSGRCSCAVVGSVDSDLSIDTFINFCRLKALSSSLSRPFMEGSDGFTMGEGGGVIILKRLDDALRHGDRIYARIAGCGMSSDGETGSMTIPSPLGQRRALQRAFASSGFRPGTVGYVEAHGTGTPIGDAVELEELGEAFAEASPHSIPVGTVKAHIGHLKSAAGMASMIKVVEALQNRTIPPAWIEGDIRDEFNQPTFPFALAPEARPWPRMGTVPRRAAVSAFGFGGSNYHLHLEEFDERQRELSSSRLLLFSGANEDGVRARVSAFSAAVGERGAVDVASVEQIAQLGGRGDCRLAVVWDGESSWDEVESRVQNALRGQSVDGVWFQRRCERKPIAFLFPGQGSVGGASFQQLRDTIPEFAARIADSGDCLDVSFDPLLWPGARSESSGSDWRKDTRLQPATTALSLALGHLLQAVGVTPDAVAGHSLGFYAALVTSGALREHDALTLLRERAACFDAAMQPDTSTMLALRTDADTARRLIDACPVVCHLANVNSPNQTGISLSTQDVPAAVEFFTNAGVESQRLSVICGFHSPFVQAAGARFEKHLQQARFRDPHCVLYSETLGARVPEHAFDAGCPGWFAEHIVKPVRFVELLEAMYDDGYRCFIEVGARGTLSRFARDTLSDVSVVSSPLDTTRDDVVHHWHELLAALYVEQGAPIDYGGYVSLFAAHLWPIATRPGAMLRAPQVDSGVPKSVQDAPSAAEGPGSVSGEADDIFNSVCEILSKFSGFERSIIQPEHEVQGTLGIDSLKTIEIGMEIEKRLGVRLAGTAFSGSLTVQGLAEEIRCAAGGAPLAQADIGRRVLEAVEVSAVPEATGGRGIALVSADRELVESWRAHGYGPAYQISLTGTCVGEALQDALAGRVSRGIVFVGDSSDVERSLLGALTLAQQRFTGEGQGEGEDACRFITASFSEAGRPVDDALCAFSKSLQRDLVHVRCGHVSFCDTIEPAAAASILYAEAIAEQEPYAFVSYCDSRRWVSHCVEASVNPKAGDALLQASDVVLVTGGGRGITAQLILALAASVKPFLILVGSTDLDSESSHADEVRDTLKRLADLGCKTDYVQCDLSRPDTVREMMQSIAKRHPPVTGVIHGAGLLADSNIAEKRASDFADVVGVKSGSARLIEAALDLSALRFWVSMSSIAAFLGNAGQTDYAAASQDLVVQAYRLKALGVATVKAVLWGPWSGMGMVVDQDLEARFAAAGVPLIGVEEGVAFLAEELRHSGDSVVAYSGPLSGFAFTEPLPDDAVWRQRAVVGAQVSLRSRRFESTEAFLADHTIDGVPVLPGVMALELSAQARPSAPYPLCWRDIQLRRLVTSRADGLVLSLCHAPVAPKTVSFSCSELGEADEPSAVGELEWGCAKPSALELGVNEEVLKTFELSALYGSDGLLFSGPRFQVIAEAVQVGDSWARSTLRDSHSAASTAKDLPCRTPAALIDGLLQVAALYCLHHLEAAYLPTAVDELWCCGEAITCASAEVIAVHRDTSDDGQHVRFDASLAVDGEPVVVRGLTMSRVG